MKQPRESARIRPYLATRGRTRPRRHIAIEALVASLDRGHRSDPEPARGDILRLCREPRSVAEIAAIVGVPLGVARVLVGDLAHEHLVSVTDPAAAEPARDLSVLERVRDGLLRL